MNHTPRILAIIPCYNESQAIGNLLEEFGRLEFPCDTLVVDDGSTDGTYDIAFKFTKVIKLPNNAGIANAIKIGIQYAYDAQYDYCIQIDGDGQHIPTEIGCFLPGLQSGSANLIIGSRYKGKVFPHAGARRIAGWLVSLFIWVCFKKWIYDPLSGMRMMDRSAMIYFLKCLDVNSLDAEIISLALKANLKVTEVLVRMRPRLTGNSYIPGLKGFKFFMKLLVRIYSIRYKIWLRGP